MLMDIVTFNWEKEIRKAKTLYYIIFSEKKKAYVKRI
jgi:hypothetical protein